MQDFGVLGSENVFFFSTMLKLSKYGISSFIGFASEIVDPKVILWKFLSLTDLS